LIPIGFVATPGMVKPFEIEEATALGAEEEED
jgi:hypothetical protein